MAASDYPTNPRNNCSRALLATLEAPLSIRRTAGGSNAGEDRSRALTAFGDSTSGDSALATIIKKPSTRSSRRPGSSGSHLDGFRRWEGLGTTLTNRDHRAFGVRSTRRMNKRQTASGKRRGHAMGSSGQSAGSKGSKEGRRLSQRAQRRGGGGGGGRGKKVTRLLAPSRFSSGRTRLFPCAVLSTRPPTLTRLSNTSLHDTLTTFLIHRRDERQWLRVSAAKCIAAGPTLC